MRKITLSGKLLSETSSYWLGLSLWSLVGLFLFLGPLQNLKEASHELRRVSEIYEKQTQESLALSNRMYEKVLSERPDSRPLSDESMPVALYGKMGVEDR